MASPDSVLTTAEDGLLKTPRQQTAANRQNYLQYSGDDRP